MIWLTLQETTLAALAGLARRMDGPDLTLATALGQKDGRYLLPVSPRTAGDLRSWLVGTRPEIPGESEARNAVLMMLPQAADDGPEVVRGEDDPD